MRAVSRAARLPEIWVRSGRVPQFVFCAGAQRRGGGCIAFVEEIEGLQGGDVDFSRVGEDALFGFEALVFAGLQFRLFNFILLKHPEID